KSSRGSIVRPALTQSADSGLNHIGRRVEVRLANFQMDDFLTLTFQGACLIQDFKGGFSAEPGHALSQSKFMLCGWIHGPRDTRLYSPAIGALSAGPSRARYPVAGCQPMSDAWAV